MRKLLAEDKYSSSMVCVNHSIIRGAGKCKHPPPPQLLLQPSLIKVFYSEDETSSNMTCVNHSIIRGAEWCKPLIPFLNWFIEETNSRFE